MSVDQANELAREWRKYVIDTLESHNAKLDKVLEIVSRLPTEFAKVDDHHELADRVASLEKNQSRFMGGIVVLNVIGSVVLSLILKFWK